MLPAVQSESRRRMTTTQTALAILTYHVSAACSTIAGLAARPNELDGPQPTPEQLDELRDALTDTVEWWYAKVVSGGDGVAAMNKLFPEFRLGAQGAQSFDDVIERIEKLMTGAQAVEDAEKVMRDAGSE
jgi:hypothetical protein